MSNGFSDWICCWLPNFFLSAIDGALNMDTIKWIIFRFPAEPSLCFQIFSRVWTHLQSLSVENFPFRPLTISKIFFICILLWHSELSAIWSCLILPPFRYLYLLSRLKWEKELRSTLWRSNFEKYVTHIFVFIFRKIVKQQLENQIIYFILLSTLEESLQVGE
jgi:hypothetical protein